MFNRLTIPSALRLILACYVLAAGSNTVAVAQNAKSIRSPRPASWIVDQPDTLSLLQKNLIDKLCDDIDRRYDRELAIAIIPTSKGIQHKQFATNLFNHWGVGSASKNNGLLIFAAIEDRKLEIVLGDGLDTPGNRAEAKRIIDDVMSPKFKKGDAGGGIYEGAHACAKRILGVGNLKVADKLPEITAEQPTTDDDSSKISKAGSAVNQPKVTAEKIPGEALKLSAKSEPAKLNPAEVSVDEASDKNVATNQLDSSKSTAPRFANDKQRNRRQPAKAARRKTNWLPWLLGLGGIGGLVTIFGTRHYLRYRKRTCDTCRLERVLLTEVQDDEFLEKPQRIEENIGSVDYDVWACLECEDVIKIRHGRWFTRYSRCPDCSYVTRFKIKKTLVVATRISGGLVRVDENCKHCSYHHTYTYATPRLPDPNSSSSGSSGWSSSGGRSSGGFGGGSSSGGGASGGW